MNTPLAAQCRQASKSIRAARITAANGGPCTRSTAARARAQGTHLEGQVAHDDAPLPELRALPRHLPRPQEAHGRRRAGSLSTVFRLRRGLLALLARLAFAAACGCGHGPHFGTVQRSHSGHSLRHLRARAQHGAEAPEQRAVPCSMHRPQAAERLNTPMPWAAAKASSRGVRPTVAYTTITASPVHPSDWRWALAVMSGGIGLTTSSTCSAPAARHVAAPGGTWPCACWQLAGCCLAAWCSAAVAHGAHMHAPAPARPRYLPRASPCRPCVPMQSPGP